MSHIYKSGSQSFSSRGSNVGPLVSSMMVETSPFDRGNMPAFQNFGSRSPLMGSTNARTSPLAPQSSSRQSSLESSGGGGPGQVTLHQMFTNTSAVGGYIPSSTNPWDAIEHAQNSGVLDSHSQRTNSRNNNSSMYINAGSSSFSQHYGNTDSIYSQGNPNGGTDSSRFLQSHIQQSPNLVQQAVSGGQFSSSSSAGPASSIIMNNNDKYYSTTSIPNGVSNRRMELVGQGSSTQMQTYETVQSGGPNSTRVADEDDDFGSLEEALEFMNTNMNESKGSNSVRMLPISELRELLVSQKVAGATTMEILRNVHTREVWLHFFARHLVKVLEKLDQANKNKFEQIQWIRSAVSSFVEAQCMSASPKEETTALLKTLSIGIESCESLKHICRDMERGGRGSAPISPVVGSDNRILRHTGGSDGSAGGGDSAGSSVELMVVVPQHQQQVKSDNYSNNSANDGMLTITDDNVSSTIPTDALVAAVRKALESVNVMSGTGVCHYGGTQHAIINDGNSLRGNRSGLSSTPMNPSGTDGDLLSCSLNFSSVEGNEDRLMSSSNGGANQLVDAATSPRVPSYSENKENQEFRTCFVTSTTGCTCTQPSVSSGGSGGQPQQGGSSLQPVGSSGIAAHHHHSTSLGRKQLHQRSPSSESGGGGTRQHKQQLQLQQPQQLQPQSGGNGRKAAVKQSRTTKQGLKRNMHVSKQLVSSSGPSDIPSQPQVSQVKVLDAGHPVAITDTSGLGSVLEEDEHMSSRKDVVPPPPPVIQQVVQQQRAYPLVSDGRGGSFDRSVIKKTYTLPDSYRSETETPQTLSPSDNFTLGGDAHDDNHSIGSSSSDRQWVMMVEGLHLNPTGVSPCGHLLHCHHHSLCHCNCVVALSATPDSWISTNSAYEKCGSSIYVSPNSPLAAQRFLKGLNVPPPSSRVVTQVSQQNGCRRFTTQPAANSSSRLSVVGTNNWPQTTMQQTAERASYVLYQV